MPSTQLLIQTVAGRDHLGRITSMGSLSRSLGASVGTAVFGTLIYSLIPTFSAEGSLSELLKTPKSVIIDAFQTAFVVAGLLAMVCAVNAARAPRIHLDDYA